MDRPETNSAEAAQPETPPRVRPGDRVHIELTTAEGVETLDLIIVPDEGADFSLGLLGQGTPLAQALIGQPLGASLPYTMGDARSVRILGISSASCAGGPGAGGQPDTAEIARRREETMRQAVEQARRTDAMIFASSFSGKWGDYDPKGIENWDQKISPDDTNTGNPAK